MIYKRCLNPDRRNKLTSKKSQARGYGKKCWADRQPVLVGAVLRKLPIARRAAEIAAGQLALDFEGADQ